MIKVSASKAEEQSSIPAVYMEIVLSPVIPLTAKLALQWRPCQAPGAVGLALGLVGPVSVYCDWVKWKVRSAASISVGQHVQLSGQIRP